MTENCTQTWGCTKNFKSYLRLQQAFYSAPQDSYLPTTPTPCHLCHITCTDTDNVMYAVAEPGLPRGGANLIPGNFYFAEKRVKIKTIGLSPPLVSVYQTALVDRGTMDAHPLSKIIINFMQFLRKKWQQERIPVRCVLTNAVATTICQYRGLGRPSLDANAPVGRPPWMQIPWMQSNHPPTPSVDRMIDRRFWKHNLPLRSVKIIG